MVTDFFPTSLAKAFTTVVSSFVTSILLPILSLLPFIRRNFDEWFAVLQPGPHYGEEGGKWGKGRGYNTLKQALDDGAVVMAYGYVLLFSSSLSWISRIGRTDEAMTFSTFLNNLFNFIGVGLGLYIIASVYTWVSSDAVIKHTVKCKFCKKRISEKVCSPPFPFSLVGVITWYGEYSTRARQSDA